jgi:hypothetical protein
MFRADFLPFASKIVEHSRYLPACRRHVVLFRLSKNFPGKKEG